MSSPFESKLHDRLLRLCLLRLIPCLHVSELVRSSICVYLCVFDGNAENALTRKKCSFFCVCVKKSSVRRTTRPYVYMNTCIASPFLCACSLVCRYAATGSTQRHTRVFLVMYVSFFFLLFVCFLWLLLLFERNARRPSACECTIGAGDEFFFFKQKMKGNYTNNKKKKRERERLATNLGERKVCFVVQHQKAGLQLPRKSPALAGTLDNRKKKKKLTPLFFLFTLSHLSCCGNE